MALKGVVVAFDAMPSAPKKTAEVIISSGNDCLGTLKGNQSGLLATVEAHFQAQQTVEQWDKGHGRIEKRTVSISHQLNGIPEFPGNGSPAITIIRGLAHDLPYQRPTTATPITIT